MFMMVSHICLLCCFLNSLWGRLWCLYTFFHIQSYSTITTHPSFKDTTVLWLVSSLILNNTTKKNPATLQCHNQNVPSKTGITYEFNSFFFLSVSYINWLFSFFFCNSTQEMEIKLTKHKKI